MADNSPPRSAGHPKGVPNRTTTALKDAILREGRIMPELPPFMRWLLARGELPVDGFLTHKELRAKGLKFEVAA